MRRTRDLHAEGRRCHQMQRAPVLRELCNVQAAWSWTRIACDKSYSHAAAAPESIGPYWARRCRRSSGKGHRTVVAGLQMQQPMAHLHWCASTRARRNARRIRLVHIPKHMHELAWWRARLLRPSAPVQTVQGTRVIKPRTPRTASFTRHPSMWLRIRRSCWNPGRSAVMEAQSMLQLMASLPVPPPRPQITRWHPCHRSAAIRCQVSVNRT